MPCSTCEPPWGDDPQDVTGSIDPRTWRQTCCWSRSACAIWRVVRVAPVSPLAALLFSRLGFRVCYQLQPWNTMEYPWSTFNRNTMEYPTHPPGRTANSCYRSHGYQLRLRPVSVVWVDYELKLPSWQAHEVDGTSTTATALLASSRGGFHGAIHDRRGILPAMQLMGWWWSAVMAGWTQHHSASLLAILHEPAPTLNHHEAFIDWPSTVHQVYVW